MCPTNAFLVYYVLILFLQICFIHVYTLIDWSGVRLDICKYERDSSLGVWKSMFFRICRQLENLPQYPFRILVHLVVQGFAIFL
jgi:hypothetical protein